MAGEFLYWDELLGRPVQVAREGREAGQIEDFYYDPATQSIYALRVKTRLNGPHILLASAIAAIDSNGVTIANENMLIDETNAGHIYSLPLGQQFIGSRVISEQGRELGAVSNLLLGVYPPIALRISAFELGWQGGRRISAHAIISIDRGVLTVMESEA
jgi:uncharacterized protein YrrD